jgi:DNA (cytosine-5)-methyltransferase 1
MVDGLPSGLDGHWAAEPEGVPRVAHGVVSRVDRLKALGNAVVPQVVEVIGRRLMEVA